MSEAADLPSSTDAVHAAHRAFFDSGATRSEAFRREALHALLDALHRRDDDIAGALAADLRKSAMEAFVSETGILILEVKHALKHLSSWMSPDKVMASLAAQPGRYVVHPQPLGTSLIVAPWNFPVTLALMPLVGALAAGCTAVVKPSELAPASSALLAEIIAETFDHDHVACVEGGVEISQELLTHPWDHFFFTGGERVGRIVARAAAEHLSRCTLELGGKSPTIVMDSADPVLAARRIAWGKFTNAGQICLAPDYVLVHERHHDVFVAALGDAIRAMYGDDPKASPDLGRIIDDRHFERLVALIEPHKVVHGGRSDAFERYIAPTVMTDVTLDDPVMAEEIFGPILPVIRVGDLDEAVSIVRQRPDPLALYLFTSRQADQDAVVSRLSFGGGCVNHVIAHFTDPTVPFGGVRGSGIGQYRGKYSFDAFTHYASMLVASGSRMLDLSVRYPPYEGKLDRVKWWVG